MPTAADLYPVEISPPGNYFAPIAGLPAGTDVTVRSDRGADHVYGRFVLWDSCVESAAETDCWFAPRSPTNYQGFHQGHVITAEGDTVQVGMVGSKGHAPPGATVAEAVAFYQYPEWSKIRAVIFEDDIGAYITGQLMPGVTYADVEMIRAAALSGHWQYREAMPLVTGGHGSGIDCLGPCLVARPGAPLPNRDDFALVAAATAADGKIETFYSIPSTVKAANNMTNPPTAAPPTFDYDGLRYTRNDLGSYDVGPVPAAGCGGVCNGGCKKSPPSATDSTTAAAESLEGAANQAELDALTARVDQIEAAFTRLEGDRMTADDMADM